MGLRSEAGEGGGGAAGHEQQGESLDQLRAGLEATWGTTRFQGQAGGALLHLKPAQPHLPTMGQGSPWLLPADQHCPGYGAATLVKARPGPEPSHPPRELINWAGPGPLSPQVPKSQEDPRQQVAVDRGLPRLSAVPCRGVPLFQKLL